jgi:hypothetical protein
VRFWVSSYFRADGTRVKGHYRKAASIEVNVHRG